MKILMVRYALIFCLLPLMGASALGKEMMDKSLIPESTECSLQLEQVASATTPLFYVSTQGNDSWSGRLAAPHSDQTDGPFRSFEKARNALREYRKGDNKDIPPVVFVRGGLYELSQPLEFGSEDGGTNESPVIWRAAPGEVVRLVGGRFLNGFQSVTDAAVLEQLPEVARDKVVALDLKKLGIDHFGSPAGEGAELFFNDKPMRLSRYPNADFMTITGLEKEGTTEKNVRGTKGITEGYFQFDDDRPLQWKNEKDIWVYGYWFWDWAAQAHKVISIDSATKMMKLIPPWHTYGYREKQWFYAYNLLCEIDEPGEFYIDREKGMLYFYPPEKIGENSALLSMVDSLLVVRNASHFIFSGFEMEACRKGAIIVSGGTGNLIVGCTIRNIGGTGISMSGAEHTVFGCHLYQIGKGGINISGGNRTTLIPGKMAALNNDIHDFGRIQRIYSSGIQVDGVGNIVANNHLSDAPHMAIGFGGNDHLIEKNKITNVCFESNDAGAIYAGRNWTMRGNILRYNYLRDIQGFRNHGCVGIYLDDMFSSADMIGNVFVRVTRAAFIGGGRDNSIVNNIFIDCKPALHIDARALGWAKYHAEGWVKEAEEKGTVTGTKWKEPPYSTKYPLLVNLLDDEPFAPKGNVVDLNICIGGYWDVNRRGQWQGDSVQKPARPYVTFNNNFVEEEGQSTDTPTEGTTPAEIKSLRSYFVDAEKEDYRLRPDAPPLKAGFQPIPFDEIGTYPHPFAVQR